MSFLCDVDLPRSGGNHIPVSLIDVRVLEARLNALSPRILLPLLLLIVVSYQQISISIRLHLNFRKEVRPSHHVPNLVLLLGLHDLDYRLLCFALFKHILTLLGGGGELVYSSSLLPLVLALSEQLRLRQLPLRVQKFMRCHLILLLASYLLGGLAAALLGLLALALQPKHLVEVDVHGARARHRSTPTVLLLVLTCNTLLSGEDHVDAALTANEELAGHGHELILGERVVHVSGDASLAMVKRGTANATPSSSELVVPGFVGDQVLPA